MSYKLLTKDEAKLFRLLTRRPRWGLSWRGWLVLLFLAVGSGLVVVLNIYPFLAINDPVPTDVMVLEGWIQGHVVREAVTMFRNEHYRVVYTTGAPVTGDGGYTNDFNTYASVGAEQLIAHGLPREVVHVAASHEGGRDRTYTSALYLKRLLRARGEKIVALNVITETTHARRSRLLFQKALGKEVRVGVVPISNPDYDPNYWWRYSSGVKDVFTEGLGYLYAKCFFFPARDKSLPPASEGN